MSRMSIFSSPLLLGFEELEQLLERAAKAPGDGYPPYNIERLVGHDGQRETLRIVLAVAGFSRECLSVTVEDQQLCIRGKQPETPAAAYLHRGIAARQFQRAFVLADGMAVQSANLENGLLTIDLERLEPERVVRTIEISS